MDIFEAIKKDHDIQRDLCDQLTETSGETEKRKVIWQELKKELKVHAEAEERFFYTDLIHHDQTQEDARHGMAEHHEMDELVEKLEETEMSSPSWLGYAKDLRDKVYHHLKDEEEDFFVVAKKVLDKSKQEKLETAYRKYMSDENCGIKAVAH